MADGNIRQYAPCEAQKTTKTEITMGNPIQHFQEAFFFSIETPCDQLP